MTINGMILEAVYNKRFDEIMENLCCDSFDRNSICFENHVDAIDHYLTKVRKSGNNTFL